jgi:hypothetical protein
MNSRNTPTIGGRPASARWWLAVIVAVIGAAAGQAQSPLVPGTRSTGGETRVAVLAQPGTAMLDPAVVPASGCSSCGSASGMPGGPGIWGYGNHPAEGCAYGGCGSEGCGENGCVPGRGPCTTCGEGQCQAVRMFCATHNALCCPDPCYEPHWVCAANAALFVDPARPVTQTRLRWDYGNNLTQPDRAEYFWGAIGQKGPARPETSVNYHELRFYQEFAADRFSFFIDMPYRNLNGAVNGGSGGFGDLNLGTKSLILDSELVQFSFQLITAIPTGAARSGTGVGHVSMDPSLLMAVKLYPDSYWQSQLGYWIPISGTPGFAGTVLHYQNSINHVVCRPLADTAFVASIEAVGYTFSSGSFTSPFNGAAVRGNNQTYFSVGPGFRFCVCDKVDFGFGVQFAVTSNHFADQLYRTELRWRF